MQNLSSKIDDAAKSIRAKDDRVITTGIILGSGLGEVNPKLTKVTEIDYHDIAHLNAPTVQSHHGRLVIGEVNNQCVAVCQGRHHLYEGYSAQEVAMLVYILAALGSEKLIVTNAAGALNPKFQAGDVMLITDHINFTGQNPLIGQDENLSERFTDMSKAYSPSLLELTTSLTREHKLEYQQGIYAGVIGPSLETSAERRMLATIGADAVGMSTVLEVIAANQCRMQVLGLSAITNMALGDEQQKVDTIEEVLRYAEIAGKKIGTIIDSLLIK